MDRFIERITGFLPNILAGILILVVAFIIATLVKKFVIGVISKGTIKEKLVSANADPRETESMIGLIGNIVFLVIFLLFLPAAFSKLGFEAISAPFANFTSFILDFLPKLVAAVVILYIGFFVAKIVKDVVSALLAKVGVDRFVAQSLRMESQPQVRISEVLASIVYAFIIIPLIIIALDIVGLTAISEPARNIISSFLGYIPNLFAACLLLGIGFFIANVLGNLLQSLLVGLNADGLLAKVGIKEEFKLSDLISKIAKAVLMVVFAVEAFRVLGLQVLNGIGTSIIAYLPLLLSAAIIMVGAFILGNFVEQKIVERNPQSRVVALGSKVAIIAVAVFMTLSQLGFAKNIVEYAFIIVLGALAIAFAVAFGIGGKDFAKKKLEELDNKLCNK